MNKDNRKNNNPDLLIVGFALLLPGMALTAMSDSNRILQVIGVILILAASAVFGASINSRVSRKK